MTPLPFVWPYALIFWPVFIWAFAPEFGILRRSREGAARKDSPDAGSLKVILVGMQIASLIAFPLAWVTRLRFPAAMAIEALGAGLALLIGGSLLRRHCWRVLGASFTGDVRVRADQQVATTGAYAFVRHPSYTGGTLMNIGIGVALGSWGSALFLGVVSVAVYIYRMNVEERALLAALGAPYREFMSTRKRLIPYLY